MQERQKTIKKGIGKMDKKTYHRFDIEDET